MISVIIPAYNIERFIARAIESVVAQSFGDWELVIINDGSTDRTLEVAGRYAAADPRIKIMSQTNKGLAAVRNEGLRFAEEDYIVFIDGDDELSPEFLSVCYEIMKARDVDIVCTDNYKFKSEKKLDRVKDKIAYKINPQIEVMDGLTAAKRSLHQTGFDSSAWGKLYRREVFDSIVFKEGEVFEDLNVMYKILLNCRQVARVDIPLYFYRQRSGSIINSVSPSKLDVLKVTKRICDFAEKEKPELIEAARDRRFAAMMNILGLVVSHPGIAYKEKTKNPKEEKKSKSDINVKKAKDLEALCLEYIKGQRKNTLLNKEARLKNRIGALLAYLPYPILRFILKRAYY